MNRHSFNRLLMRATLVAIAAMPLLTSQVTFAGTRAPSLDYQLIAQQQDRTGSSFLTTAPGFGSLDGLNRAAQTAGISASEAANLISQLPSNVPFVLGRYSPVSGDLAIEVYKVERQGLRTGVYRARFTPSHGQLWAQARTYMDPTLKQQGLAVGANPFAQFVGNNPTLFEAVSFDAGQVAMGHAMRFVSAPMGVLVASIPRTEQTMRTVRGSYMRKSVEIQTTGYLQPKWYIAAPPEFQPSGSSAAICVDPSGSCSGKPYMVAPAMVTFQEWQGGTMSAVEDTALMSGWLSDAPNFTFDNFVAAAYVYTFAASSIQSAVQGSGAATSSFTRSLQEYVPSGTPGGTNSASVAADESGFYDGLQSLISGASLRTVQNSYVNSASMGRFTPPPGSTGSFAQEFIAKSEQETVTDDPTTGGLSGVKQYAVGACAADKTIAQCGATSSGVLPRADVYVELDVTRFYQDTTH